MKKKKKEQWFESPGRLLFRLDICDSVYSKDDPAMPGAENAGFVLSVKEEESGIMITHDMLHQHALFSKTFPTNVKDVLSPEVIAANVASSLWSKSFPSPVPVFLFFFKEKVPGTLLLPLEKKITFFPEARCYCFSKIYEKNVSFSSQSKQTT